MPFGALPESGGGARFALWAPAAEQVEVSLEGSRRALAREPEGWFRGVLPEARIGQRYWLEIEGREGRIRVPDPASRFQPEGAAGPSQLIDPGSFAWSDAGWSGRPFEEAVFYELHVGAFTARGDYGGVSERLDALAELGVTSIELMPLAEWPGARNWGYDGVLPYAPASRYGRPEELKSLVDAAHQRGLMVFLDVVYNHFGPEGNYLRAYAPQFFTAEHGTPWGEAIDFESPTSRPVRDFFVHNALFWLEEYHLDGLRLDAVHAIHDRSEPDLLEELAARVAEHFGEERAVHLVLENDDNSASRLARAANHAPRSYTAQWNDDLHHALHVLLTGEQEGYYADYAESPSRHLGRCLREGFAYQGEPSEHRDGARRGESTAGLPPSAFVGFLQNHDQIGNRALGERIQRLAPAQAVRAAHDLLLLSPSPPLLFMGEEWGAQQPFLFFCDFEGELADAVREGRRREFARFAAFRDPETRARIPDPCARETFERSVLRWEDREREPHRSILERTRRLLELRRREIAPRLAGARADGPLERFGGAGLQVAWQLSGARLVLRSNLSAEAVACPPAAPPGRLLAATPDGLPGEIARGRLPAWSCGLWLDAQA